MPKRFFFMIGSQKDRQGLSPQYARRS